MKLGTIVYENQIYNLDYMTSEEIKDLINLIEKDKLNQITKGKKLENN